MRPPDHGPALPKRRKRRVLAPIITIRGLTKRYASGFQALNGVDLDIERGEIFALLGPNGAGKTSLINIVCGVARRTAGEVRVGRFDIVKDYRASRAMIGLVPQELATDAFESVLATVRFSRGLFGRAPDPALIEQILRQLSLWEKRNAHIRTLSGGMKRRVMIAKALSHEPQVLFLDEPTAGVDVELRRDMWTMVRGLRAQGVTIILTTHYIEEAEEMADRIGVIRRGELILVEEKEALMRRFGRKRLAVTLKAPIGRAPAALEPFGAELSADGRTLSCALDGEPSGADAGGLVAALAGLGLPIVDVETRESTLEDIFVRLVHDGDETARDETARERAR